MTENTTINHNNGVVDELQLQRDELVRTQENEAEEKVQPSIQMAQGIACPFCGSVNEPGAVFCLSCGKPLSKGACPNCGSEMDIDADFCEVCHHYIKSDVCSFCGATLTGTEAYCPECGRPVEQYWSKYLLFQHPT